MKHRNISFTELDFFLNIYLDYFMDRFNKISVWVISAIFLLKRTTWTWPGCIGDIWNDS